MQYYSELIETSTNRSLGYVKVTNHNANDMTLTEVTMNGNNFFKLGPVGCHLKAILLTDGVLARAGFARGNGSQRFLSIGQQAMVYSKLFASGWCLEILFDGQNFYYIKPEPNSPNGYVQYLVTTVEDLQNVVRAKENKEFSLSLLDTIVNKAKLKEKLLDHYGARYIPIDGPCNGMYVDNDSNRPDFVFLRLEPVKVNVDPAVIELNHFNARGCTISIRLGNDVVQYTYGMSFKAIRLGLAHMQPVFNQYQGVIQEVYESVEEAMDYALTC